MRSNLPKWSSDALEFFVVIPYMPETSYQNSNTFVKFNRCFSPLLFICYVIILKHILERVCCCDYLCARHVDSKAILTRIFVDNQSLPFRQILFEMESGLVLTLEQWGIQRVSGDPVPPQFLFFKTGYSDKFEVCDPIIQFGHTHILVISEHPSQTEILIPTPELKVRQYPGGLYIR